MTDRQYIKQMIVLTRELERVAEAEPFDPLEWQSALDEFHLVNCRWYKGRRRRHLVPAGFIFFLVCFLFWLVWQILS